ncbi:DNA sulfur modification protein DndE [Alteromonas stellipolaris]|uniref:DNA sulfur modification protein DndE n=1 Tax=Alteromonas stellipolaris TaxID=233316 RepID=UPI0027344B77|nr:DNA sulfur modification protein DndE [Alteromonas stellipolaris]MDP2535494.1 DNA sulfur modification protein DndE [Alteromonas stellipolaris]
MLPNRMQLSRTVEEQLKKLKGYTGVTPNVSARIAFFRSIESDFRYDPATEYATNGSLTLDKITWLGRTQEMTELLLKHTYPDLEGKQLQQAWAAHVEHGIAVLRNHKTLNSLTETLDHK